MTVAELREILNDPDLPPDTPVRVQTTHRVSTWEWTLEAASVTLAGVPSAGAAVDPPGRRRRPTLSGWQRDTEVATILGLVWRPATLWQRLWHRRRR